MKCHIMGGGGSEECQKVSCIGKIGHNKNLRVTWYNQHLQNFVIETDNTQKNKVKIINHKSVYVLLIYVKTRALFKLLNREKALVSSSLAVIIFVEHFRTYKL